MHMDDLAANHDSALNLIDLLKSCQFNKENCNISVSTKGCSGTIHVRHGVILSAHAGILHGNGALLSLAQQQGASISTEHDETPIQKTVFLSIEQVLRFLSHQKPVARPADHDDEKVLEEAKSLLFRFHYKEAVDRLITILKQNRFFYPAWLWQSRLLTKQDYISRALDEAYRWGNHDQDVWRESRKMRPQISHSETPVKRCIFCWSILHSSKSCSYCKARFSITAMQAAADMKKEEINFALNGFEQAHQHDPKNAKVSFALALGYFNLKEYNTSLGYLEKAVEISPKTSLYTKSLSLLQTIIKADKANQKVELPPQRVAEVQPALPQILMVEDSMTSRKVLSMLLKKYDLQLLEAATGQEALSLAASENPQLILLDLMLPDANGHDLLVQIRKFEHLKEVPVIMLTGRHDAKDRLKGMQGGAQEYVTKPFNPQKLTDLIQSYLKVESKPNKPVQRVAKARTTATNTRTPASIRPPAAVQGRPAVMQPPAVKASVQPQAAPSGNKTILVVEDSRTSRKVLTMLLSRHGFTLYEAESGKEALELAPTISPDLVLLDVMLPDMTGYTILPKLRELDHYAKLPFVMLTGNRKATDRLQGMLAGTNEYITKPFDPQKLLGIIKNYL